jgi:NAD(P)-dependent dehydrogenase (short-subunit alcohol dehydrogenase family)
MLTDAAVEVNVAAVVERCIAEFGGLDVFFANIGITGTTRRCSRQSVEEWERRLAGQRRELLPAVKVRGRVMTRQGSGSIILTSVGRVRCGRTPARSRTAASKSV